MNVIEKSIVLMQPHATLIGLGVQQVLPRSRPPSGPMCPHYIQGYSKLRVNRAERITIYSSAMPAEEGLRLSEAYGTYVMSEFLVDNGRLLDLCNEEVHDLPLGVPICTVEVVEAAPVSRCWAPGKIRSEGFGRNTVTSRDEWYWDLPPGREAWREDLLDVSDQIPYGNFKQDGWVWMFDNPEWCE